MAAGRFNIFLPPIRDDDAGYTYLCKLSEAIISSPENHYVFEFSRCSTLSHNGLVVIGGLGDFLNRYEKNTTMLRGLGLPKFFAPQKVGFNIENISPLLMSKLQTLGFWNYVKPDFGIKGNLILV